MDSFAGGPGTPTFRPCATSLESWGTGLVVCMWDGATRSGSHAAGGMVLITPAKVILLAKGVQFHSIDDPMVVELLLMQEAIGWCLGRGFTEVTFEGDAKVIIENVNQAETRDNRMGAMLEEIVHSLVFHSRSRVRFVGRRNNRVAHLVARKALSLSPTMSCLFGFQEWLNSKM
ncbi:unnamed protein product [Linum trigynum]|uniref:RNase H type-1 domain-containing protein n=1 Tax=Linum trigynum TaxID=586398 RepID=A0AAV2F699_9ROSI